MRPLLAIFVLVSCTHDAAPRTWPRESSLHMAASHRCQGQRCTCRDAGSAADAAESTPPAPGTKRFELRVGPSMDSVWLDVTGHGIWLKDTEPSAEGCAYVDLKAGEKVHVIEHVEAQEKTRGTALDVRISEYNPKLQVWYDTARVECGGGGDACNREMMAAWLERMHKLPRGLHDPCGSTKIEEPTWSAAETDLPHPSVITADVTLHVYTFEPRSAPGSAECGKRHQDTE
jgi:hypothetical protein